MYGCIRKGEKETTYGYTRIAEMNGPYANIPADFGALRLKKNQNFKEEQPLEYAHMLIYGEVTIQWEDKQRTVRRENCFDESPWVLHMLAGTKVPIVGEAEDSEVVIHRISNDTVFNVSLYAPEDVADKFHGVDTMRETCTRIVRTVFDKSSAPWSNMILGEVINIPGK